MGHNYKIYAGHIKSQIPSISEDDLRWLCNRAAKLYRKIDDGCVDNFRCCDTWMHTESYKKALSRGCCGFIDILVKNPRTGNSFCIGFNYGH